MEPIRKREVVAGGAVQKVVQVGAMLQTVPRVPVAGVKRRWGGRVVAGLQESSPEVSSSGVLSPPPPPHYYQPVTPDSAARNADDLQLWDLDLHRGLHAAHEEQRHDNSHNTVITAGDPTSPCPTAIEGTFFVAFSSSFEQKKFFFILLTCIVAVNVRLYFIIVCFFGRVCVCV